MAIRTSTRAGRIFKFHSDAVEEDTLMLVSLDGLEALSRPFQYELNLTSRKKDLDLGKILRERAYIGIKQGVSLPGGRTRGVQNLRIHGMLAEFEQGEEGGGWVIYRALFVPRLWRLSLNIRYRIFQNLSVPQIVEQVLRDNGLASEDFEFRAGAREYPQREYVVQYQESDLDFVSRLLEHEGIYYYFQYGEEGEKVVFGDSTAGCEPLPGDQDFPFRKAIAGDGKRMAAMELLQQDGITRFTGRRNWVHQKVVLGDYNYRTPSVGLQSEAKIAEEGWGVFHSYGEHFKTPKEGLELAQIRAEEATCRERQFRGAGDIRSLHPGYVFGLTGYYREDFNASYLVTEIRHRGDQSISMEAAGQVNASYENEFTAIPAEVVFRPRRVTRKPKITGTITARVDAGGEGKYAEIDDQGRYKVTIPFDLSGSGGGKASRYIRMAQPYAGGGMGMHFPLHKGTEVLLTHVNGDPDRPIIAAAVPNPEAGSPVTGSNHSQCVINTGGANTLVFEDTDGGQRMYMASPCPGAGTFISFGAPMAE